MNASILMVDDQPENLLALGAILEPLGCNLVEAHSGSEALKYLLKEEFALILMDVQMPGIDGFETATLIKEREKTRHIPIIFVTAISKEQHYIFKGYSAGAVDYISKPLNPDILRSKVAVFVELWNKTQQIKEQGERLRQAEQREKERQLNELEHELQRRHMAALAESESRLSRFKATLDATLDSVFMFDPKTLRYLYANQGARRHLGYEEHEILQLTSLAIKPDINEEEFRELLRKLSSSEEPALRFETRHRRKDGSLVPVEVFLQYIAPLGEEGRFVSIVRDISDRKRTEEDLRLAKENAEHARELAERANRAKSDFIAGVSHELRTPLNAIIGFSKLLFNPRVGPLNTDQEAYIKDVVQSAEHLLHLINDILDLSKIEAGKMKLEPSQFSLPDLLEQSTTIVREKARLHRLALTIDVAPEVAALPYVEADARKIKQVLYNLLSNAVKFTPDGGSITVTATLQENEAEDHGILISVTDTGIGIAPEHKARIFAAFEQVDNSYTRQQQGTGLGLALCQRIMELHEGRIWVESVEGEGSTFSFCIPLPATASSSPDPGSAASEPADSKASTQGAMRDSDGKTKKTVAKNGKAPSGNLSGQRKTSNRERKEVAKT
jgi:PAS domain S-box-containing protein